MRSDFPLLRDFQGDWLDDEVSREVYSRDASIFRIRPKAIAHPKTPNDLLLLIALANKENIPLIPRGGATATTGASLGVGILVDFSKYMNKIIDFNGEKEIITVEAGAIADDINQFLAPKGLRLGPETSTANRATIGGMAACNASGARSLRFGTMMENIEEIEIFTADKERLIFNEAAPPDNSPLFSHLLPWLTEVKLQDREEIERRFAQGHRHVSGYPLNEIIKPDPFNYAKLLVGSEGTLALFNTLKMKCVRFSGLAGMIAIHFTTMEEALSAIEPISHWAPLSLELIDRHILELARASPKLANKLYWLRGDPQAVVIAEFDAESTKELKLRLSGFEADLRRQHIGYYLHEMSDKEGMKDIWDVRKEGLGLLMSKRSYTNAVAFVEDLACPPRELPEFCRELTGLLKKNQKEYGLYGHLGAGCLHLRPYLNLQDAQDVDLMERLLNEISTLVLKFHGALSGEHGDGLIRSALNKKMFGEKLYARFGQLKQLFDPRNLLNPGKIVSAPSFEETKQWFRLSPETTTIPLTPFFNYIQKGGLALEIDLCNGNGLCRKKEGLMCPSFQATRDERDSTRGRADALFGLIHGKFQQREFASKEVASVLDLCLECKGCKRECPSSVDMAKLKMELLYHIQKKEGIDLRSRLLSSMPDLLPFLSYFPSLSNHFLTSPLAAWGKKRLGLSTRPLPLLAKKPFSSRIRKQVPGPQILLLIDTYTQFYNPEIGYSAELILKTMGFSPRSRYLGCCGRPLFSKGRLEEGKKKALAYAKAISPFLNSCEAILSLEPSCHSVIIDEYRDLHEPTLNFLAHRVTAFDQFVWSHWDLLAPHLLTRADLLVQYHRHCHDKSLQDNNPTLSLLEKVPLVWAEEIPSGCCGMAGAFGYEQEHEALSAQIANLVLLKSLKEEENGIVIANGFSCRSQILDLGKKKAFHIAEFLGKCISGHTH